MAAKVPPAFKKNQFTKKSGKSGGKSGGVAKGKKTMSSKGSSLKGKGK